MISRGQIYWIDLGDPAGLEKEFRRPVVVVQNDLFNQSRINTTVVCSITTNLKRAKAPGNVLLPKGEAGLSKDSVVNVSQIFTVAKEDLKEMVGQLGANRTNQITEGLKLLLES